MSTIGFIGLGNMGFPMAGRLAASGHRLIVQDVDAGAVERFLAAHPSAAPASDGAWSEADIIITMLPNSAIVEQVLLDGGVAARAALDTLFVDMSSSEPVRSRQLGAVLRDRGMRYVDAPVSGGVRGAANGQLATMAGGTAADVEQVSKLFGVLGKSTIHVGDVGAGHAAKALNNLVSAASVLSTVEALRIGEKFGMAPETLVDVLNASSGRSNTSENKVRQFMLNGSFASGFPLGLMAKDVRIAVGLAETLGVGAEFGRGCAALWEAACEAGFAADDHTKMYEVLARLQPAAAGKQ
ncbi:NAD(P)-dependent oxidoreductase [Arthrobacter mobilis]|uniref:NAD(P)-dependent oxidoreductase n=1 Tax=Arthrobacter mobilis TaxID=2724944 RepID=A0A7X6K5W4_9MICC|nr:NAD(P)-dependent oxidoreductase [Arthrobacter mobilis]NKX54365.1 NAD(P)-dependent oxidoreductase [Arthrobacter mobilis]